MVREEKKIGEEIGGNYWEKENIQMMSPIREEKQGTRNCYRVAESAELARGAHQLRRISSIAKTPKHTLFC